MTNEIVRDVTSQGFLAAMEILQIIETMERLNFGDIINNINRAEAARAGTVVMNGLLSRLVLLVAGAFAPVRHPGDRHLRQAVISLRSKTDRSSPTNLRLSTKFSAALLHWDRLELDPRQLVIKHFRDKSTAHIATPNPGISKPKYDELFGFARELASLFEMFAEAAGTLPEPLSETQEYRIDSSEAFWRPWERARE